MQAHDSRDEAQAKAAADLLAIAFESDEWLQYARTILRRDAGTIVCNA